MKGGRRTPQTLLLLDERDKFLIEAGMFLPDLSDRAVARPPSRATFRGTRAFARSGFKLDLREIGWAPYVMIGGGLGVGALVLAIAMFLKHG